MGSLSAHFDASEFRCPCPRTGQHNVRIDPELVQVLERIRALTGKPLPIISGHRCRPHQWEVNPGIVGFHPSGRAADIPQGRVRPQQARRLGARGVGVRNGWAVHIDTRTSRPVIFAD